MGILDICILVIVALAILVGVCRGFVKSILGVFSGLIALLLGIFVSPPMAKALATTGISDSISGKIIGFLNTKGELFTTPPSELVKEKVTEGLNQLKIPAFLHNIIIGKIDFSSLGSDTLANVIGSRLTNIVCLLICFLLIAIVSRIILKIIEVVLKKHLRNRILKRVDRGLGAVAGLINAVVIVSIAMFVVSLLATIPGEMMSGFNAWIAKDLGSKFGLARIIYEHNPIISMYNLMLGGK